MFSAKTPPVVECFYGNARDEEYLNIKPKHEKAPVKAINKPA
jgi:hypothetical protein